MTSTTRKENNPTRIDEKIKGLYKIIADGYKRVDQDSWIMDQEISWGALNAYLGLNVVPGELIPYETCMKVVGEFTAIGLDWDDIPKEGLDLMGLLSSIQMHIVPTSLNLTMKNEYLFSSFEALRNNDQKHYFAGDEFKGVHLNLGVFDGVTPNRNGRIYPKGSMDPSMGNHDPEVPRKIFVTDLKNVDLKDLWASLQDINIEDAYPKPGESAHSFGELDDGYPITQHYYSGTAITDNIIHDVYPDMIYPEEQLELYTERPWLTPEEAASAGIVVRLDGNPLHPRHWRYAAGNGLIVFLDNKIDSGRVEVEADVLSGSIALRFLPKWMREGKYGAFDKFVNAYTLPEEYLNVLQADIDAGKIKICIVGPKSNVYNSWRDAIKKQLEGNTDVILIDSLPADIFKNGINRGIAVGGIGTVQMLERANYAAFAKQAQGYFEREPVPNEPTVKGNSRQAIIDNGKRTWPAPRNKKGHRRHGK